MLSMITSLLTIVVTLIIGNRIGQDLPMASQIIIRMKVVPILLSLAIFKTLSLVIILTYLRIYAIVPISIMFFSQIMIAMKVRKVPLVKAYKWSGALQQLPYMVMAIVSGQIFKPINKFDNSQSTYYKELRRRLLTIDAIVMLIINGSTLLSIIILWKTTFLLHDNLGLCTLTILKENTVSVCAFVISFGLFNLILLRVSFRALSS